MLLFTLYGNICWEMSDKEMAWNKYHSDTDDWLNTAK